MCAPDWPSPDKYDSNIQVKPHFSKTPGLTEIPAKHRYRKKANEVQRDVSDLYRKYGLKRCPHYGLFWAGSKRWTAIADRDKTMLLVIELRDTNIKQWREIDAEARGILAKHELSGKNGVCVRYYEYWRDDTDSDDEAIMGSEGEDVASQGTVARRFGGHSSEWRRLLERTTVVGASLPVPPSPSASDHVRTYEVEPPWLDPRDQGHMTLAERAAQRARHWVI